MFFWNQQQQQNGRIVFPGLIFIYYTKGNTSKGQYYHRFVKLLYINVFLLNIIRVNYYNRRRALICNHYIVHYSLHAHDNSRKEYWGKGVKKRGSRINCTRFWSQQTFFSIKPIKDNYVHVRNFEERKGMIQQLIRKWKWCKSSQW